MGKQEGKRPLCLGNQPETAWVPSQLWPHSVIMEDTDGNITGGGADQAAAPCSSITPALHWSGPDISKGKKQQESLFIQRKGAASRANADHALQQMPAHRGLCQLPFLALGALVSDTLIPLTQGPFAGGLTWLVSRET
ncbi:insulin-like growth factor-binding protein complex acid labile subunit [Platysternon megacephalum]|uniref:Insulin-like growth factor-binding protein complex acid labile subunit n=1 Tax=Platysternon megacephalum TaxID=55544 RepID=A0A4D9E6H0_9SAUR|nr:insulin-like growth factor-binding protein complex acid labile subunit [Platysternon megacephalum]